MMLPVHLGTSVPTLPDTGFSPRWLSTCLLALYPGMGECLIKCCPPHTTSGGRCCVLLPQKQSYHGVLKHVCSSRHCWLSVSVGCITFSLLVWGGHLQHLSSLDFASSCFAGIFTFQFKMVQHNILLCPLYFPKLPLSSSISILLSGHEMTYITRWDFGHIAQPYNQVMLH